MAGYYWNRRLRNLLLTAAVILLLWRYLAHQENELQRASFTSGYLLLVGLLFLAGFHLRKQLSFLPLGSASTWMQLHLYVGYVVIGLFVMHVPARAPNGLFETTLYSLFVLVCLSGIYGLTITRQLPRRISKLKEEVLFERIPVLRDEVERRAHAVMTQLLERSAAEALADYYVASLIPYFAQPRGAVYALRPTGRRRNQLHADLDALARYESDAEGKAERQLRQLIDKRDDLDYHEAQQRKLKVWLFAHIGLTYGLLSAALFHTALVHAFWGGAR